jgi:hypothetical protein
MNEQEGCLREIFRITKDRERSAQQRQYLEVGTARRCMVEGWASTNKAGEEGGGKSKEVYNGIVGDGVCRQVNVSTN